MARQEPSQVNVLLGAAQHPLQFCLTLYAHAIDRLLEVIAILRAVKPAEVECAPEEVQRGWATACKGSVLFGRPSITRENKGLSEKGTHGVKPHGTAVVHEFGMAELRTREVGERTS